MPVVKTISDFQSKSNLHQKLLKAESQSFANVKCKSHSVLMNELKIKIIENSKNSESL